MRLEFIGTGVMTKAVVTGLVRSGTSFDRIFLSRPGGLNEQLHAELSSCGAYGHYGKALDRVLARIQGRSISELQEQE